jgi:LysR family glycine cleavage system transcriptional activator
VALSPAAFSERIRRLEEGLSVRLLERGGRSVMLTPAGERLLPHVRQLLREARQCHSIASSEFIPPYSLTIGTRFELGLSWLLPALDTLKETEPAREIHLVFGSSQDLLLALESGRLDGVVGSMRLTRSALEYVLLHEESYSLIASPALLEETPLRGPEDAERHTLIDATRDLPLFRYWQDAQPPEQSWRFARHSYMSTIAAIRARALVGAGIAVLPTYFVAPDLEAGRLISPLLGRAARSDWFRLVWRAEHLHPGRLEALGEALRQLPLQ